MKKKYNGIILLFALLLTVVLSLSDAPEVMAAKSSGKVKSVTVTNLPSNTLTLKKGKSKTLKIKVASTNKKKVSQKVTCKSSAPKVASVTNAGKVTAKKNGTAKITITSVANNKKKAVVTVKVGTPVTKISLDRASVTLDVKGSATVRATVTPSKATNKSLEWKSSNTKVATVNGQGKITGVKAGTANITVTATDGSGIKKTIRVTVIKRTTVSVSVVNGSTVKASLSAAQKLAVSDFTVKVKAYESGRRYNRVCKLESVKTVNNKDYLLALDPSYKMTDRISVQVTVRGLPGGASSGETVCDEGVFKYTRTLSFEERADAYVDPEERQITGLGSGYSAFTVKDLPKGIRSEVKGDSIRFYGKPSEKGTFVSTITSIDELGNTYTYAVTWMIGSKDTLSAVASPQYFLLAPGQTVYVTSRVATTGGSGSYKYSLSGNTSGLTIGESSGEIEGELKAADTYKLTVNVEDRNDPACKTTTEAVIHVAAGITVSGNVVDRANNPVPDTFISFKNKDKADKYTEYRYKETQTDERGVYTMTLPSGTFDIDISYASRSRHDPVYQHLYDQKLDTSRSDLNISLPLRKVLIESSDSNIAAINGSWEWFDGYGRSWGYGDTFFLRDGSAHKWTASREQGHRKITAVADFTANASTARTVATVTAEEIQRPSIVPGTPVKLSVKEDETVYYLFKPAQAGRYYFYSTDYDRYAYVYLEDVDGNTLASCQNRFDENDNANGFWFGYEAQAGQSYYLRIRNERASDLTASISVGTQKPEGFDTTPAETSQEDAAAVSMEEGDGMEGIKDGPNEVLADR